MSRRWFAFLALFALGVTVRADEPPGQVIRLKVQPAAAPVPALKYRLLPDASELQPGNAVTAYYRSFALGFSLHRHAAIQEEIDAWLQAHSEKKRPKVPADLHFLMNDWALQQVDRGARCEVCAWELSERVRQEGFALVLPEPHLLHVWAKLLTIRCHLELEAGDLTKAMYTCRTGLALARHIAEAPVMLTLLTGISIAVMMLENVQDIIATPGSPNLYWALTELPRPFVDLRRPLQGDLLGSGITSSQAELEKGPVSLERLAELQERLRQITFYMGDRFSAEHYREAATFITLKGYPFARRWLLAQGKPAEEVERLPTFQVVLLYSLAEYRRLSDDFLKLHSLPYWQARPLLETYDRQVRSSRVASHTFPFAAALLPAYAKVMTARMRVERHIDALRVVEALRLHAAKHGSWPASLDEIAEVPIPWDCCTGKPFEYRRDGNKASILGPAMAPPLFQNAIHYELTLVK